ncbi:hypothetical protein PSTG_18279, partial [Puccinia striiformis f. sp. tritici PST-78]
IDDRETARSLPPTEPVPVILPTRCKYSFISPSVDESYCITSPTFGASIPRPANDVQNRIVQTPFSGFENVFKDFNGVCKSKLPCNLYILTPGKTFDLLINFLFPSSSSFLVGVVIPPRASK